MSEPKLTPWFSMRWSSPTLPGIYQVSCRNNNQTGLWYAHFDGEAWSAWENVARAGSWSALVREVTGSLSPLWSPHDIEWPKATWRGLAEKPE